MKVLFVDFPSESLLIELRKHRCETTNLVTGRIERRPPSTDFPRLVSRLSLDNDVFYYSKFVTRRLDEFPPYISGIKCKSILGFHAPTIIPRADRAIYKFYNLVNCARLVMHKCTGLFDAFHSLNSFDQAILTKMGFRSHLLPMGFDEDLFRPRDKSQEQFRVLFTGFYYHKGADLAAKVARALGRTHRNISFIFVDGARKTDADNALSYKNYLSERSADNTLIFDQMDEEKFAELLGQAHLLLFPSRWESFGRVVVEALGSGCPVNCFDIMGPPCSLIRSSGTGYVARAFDPNELAYGILKFYDLWKSRFDEYLELSEKCRRLSLRFSWKRLAPMYLRMFEAVAGLGQT